MSEISDKDLESILEDIKLMTEDPDSFANSVYALEEALNE